MVFNGQMGLLTNAKILILSFLVNKALGLVFIPVIMRFSFSDAKCLICMCKSKIIISELC